MGDKDIATSGSKTCFKCGKVATLDAFYRHPAMADGRLGKCKECTKSDVRARRHANIDALRAYDRARGARRTSEDARLYRNRNPHKTKAHAAVARAIRAGTVERAACMICGRTDSHAHHDNYARPLDVVWLCPVHHFERHKTL